jgi:mRNA interferase HigB
MRIIVIKALRAFWEQHRDAEQALRAWHAEAKSETWTCPDDIKQRYRNADFLPDNRVVFDIKGNKYRLIAKINYNRRIVYIRFVGTHAEYDRIDARTV